MATFELVSTADSVQFYGNAFVPERLTSARTIVVDGDLVTPLLVAPAVRVRNGSLLCPEIICEDVEADILGVFDLAQPYTGCAQYRYLRPCVALPSEASWGSAASIMNGAWLFLRPEIVCQPDIVKPFITRAMVRPSCGRARVLFRVALEELIAHPEALTPLGRQIVACFAVNPDIPDYWRF